MIKLSSCIEMMFTELPFEERIEAAKKAGFSAWEMWNWADRDIQALGEAMEKADLPAAGCIVGSRDDQRISAWQKGGMLVGSNASLFAEMIEETISTVDPLGIKTFIVTTGNALENVPREQQQQGVVSCLSAAVPVLKKHGCTIVLE